MREQIRRVRTSFERIEQKYVGFYILRVILALVIFATVLAGRPVASTLLIAASIVIGFVEFKRSRKRAQGTQFESVLNAFADKALIILASAALYMQGILPWWAALIFISKDVLFVLGGVVALLRNRRTVFKSKLISKATLFVQLAALIAPIVDRLDTVLLLIASIFTIVNMFVIALKPEFISVRQRGYDEFAFRRMLKLADIITLAGVAVALIAIVLALAGYLTVALVLLMVCVVFDFLDGKVARMTNSANEFGKQLDSLADTVSFGVTPMIIGLTLIQSKLAIAAFTIFLFAGILRLAKFNVMTSDGEYVGMPITFNGIIVPVVLLAGLPGVYIPYLFLALGMFMIAPVRIKKSL